MKTFDIFYENDGSDKEICALMDELEEITEGHTKNIGGWAVTRWHDEGWEIGTWGKPEKMLGKEHAAEAMASSTNK